MQSQFQTTLSALLHCSLLFALVGFEATAAEAQPDSETVNPRYFDVVESELSAMSVSATCQVTDENRATCNYVHHGQRSEHDFTLKLIYSDESDTIFMYVDRFLMAPIANPGTPALLAHLMELNWAMLAGKFEWDSNDGEIRLSVTLHTDSNFDRRAFRNLLHSLALRADRYYVELRRMVTPDSDSDSDTGE
jgi:hypothetical protein